MGFVVSSHFKGKKTEAQTSELGQGQQPIKIEELRFKLNLLTLCLGGRGYIMPFQVIIQVIVAPEFERVCVSEQGVPCRCLYKMPFSEDSGQRALW